MEVYNITIQSLAVEGFSFEVECVKAEKDMLTYLPNPTTKALKKQYGRLRRLDFSEEETRNDSIPVHIILGAADYQRIHTTEPLILRVNPGKDIGAEFTMLCWTIYGRQLMAEDWSPVVSKKHLLSVSILSPWAVPRDVIFSAHILSVSQWISSHIHLKVFH